MNIPIRRFYLIAAIILALFLISLPFLEISAEEVGAFPGNIAPDFNLESLDGEEVVLNQFDEDTVFLTFWTTWCPACQEKLPDIQTLDKNFSEEITVLTVNTGESPGEVENFIEENDYDFETLLDQDQEIAQDYMVRGIPVTFILGEDNIIEERYTGPLPYEEKLEILNLE